MSEPIDLSSIKEFLELQLILERCSDDNVKSLSVDELRENRNKIQAAEVSISIARRVAQGWLDIILVEKQKWIDQNDEDLEVPELLPDLVSLLSSNPTVESDGASPRLAASLLDGSNCDSGLLEMLLERLDIILVTKDMGEWFNGSPEFLEETVENIAKFEKLLSQSRKKCHRSIDTLQDEIVSRIKSAEVKLDQIIR